MRKNHPLDLFGEKVMKEGIGRALQIFSGGKISLAIVFHLECAELTKFQEFLKMVLRSKNDPKEGRLYKKARLPPLHQVWEVRKKKSKVS